MAILDVDFLLSIESLPTQSAYRVEKANLDDPAAQSAGRNITDSIG